MIGVGWYTPEAGPPHHSRFSVSEPSLYATLPDRVRSGGAGGDAMVFAVAVRIAARSRGMGTVDGRGGRGFASLAGFGSIQAVQDAMVRGGDIYPGWRPPGAGTMS